MSEVLIKVDAVSKKFCRSLKRSLWYGLQDLGKEVLGRSHGGNGELRPDEFWAVRDVSFELKRGECLGLIGPNGAGKTTLLRMLNGLIKPDGGRIEMRGRVGALIALGAGFNPILTGRENIYVNASVLGLCKKEIDAKVEEIIDFAEIGEFIDTPVQNYSSGMSIRLGFAVAMAVEPDVVILDEVLAVGDARFRAKCYGRISELLDKSAVILVSHNMDQVNQICNAGLLLEKGRCVSAGDVGKCISYYSCIGNNSNNNEVCEHSSPSVKVVSSEITRTINYGDNVSVGLNICLSRDVLTADVKFTVFSADGVVVLEAYSKYFDKCTRLYGKNYELQIDIGPILLSSGKYAASLVLLDRSNNEHLYWGSRVFSFFVNGPAAGAERVVLPVDVSIRQIITSTLG